MENYTNYDKRCYDSEYNHNESVNWNIEECPKIYIISLLVGIYIIFEDLIFSLYKNRIIGINDYIKFTSNKYRKNKEYKYFYNTIIKKELYERSLNDPMYNIYWNRYENNFKYIHKRTSNIEIYNLDEYPNVNK